LIPSISRARKPAEPAEPTTIDSAESSPGSGVQVQVQAPDQGANGLACVRTAYVAERRHRAYELRIAGYDARAIAAALESEGYGSVSPATVTGDIKLIGREHAERMRAAGDGLRALELARLDSLWRAWYAQGTTGIDVYAAPILLRVLELRMKLLHLDDMPIAEPIADRPLATLSDSDLLARLAGAQDIARESDVHDAIAGEIETDTGSSEPGST
jgi:hypothetical protein